MKLLLSWSGEKSKKIAEALNSWIPTVLQPVKPFYSVEDIAKGKRWSNELASTLEDTDFGIIIMTEENVKAPWILFEAGALSKNIQSGRVCTLLFGIKETDLQGPLSQFQNTKFDKNDVKNLIKEMNNYLGENGLEEKALDKVFEKMWEDLENDIVKILESHDNNVDEKEIRSERELLEEILRNTRKIQYRHLFERKQEENVISIKDEKSKVIFEEEHNSIVFYVDDEEKYFIGINQLTNTSEVLDFIFQVNRKGWSTPNHIKGFLDCLEELADQYFDQNAQGIFCPMGKFMSLDWESLRAREAY